MSDYNTKATPLFFTPDDEVRFMELLVARLPRCVLIEGSLWDSDKPPTRAAFSACQSMVVFLWNRASHPYLPFKRLPTGRFQGPTSGVVIQVCRSRSTDGVLLSGGIGAGYDIQDGGMVSFVREVWAVLNQLKAGPLASVNPMTRNKIITNICEYALGPGAKQFAADGGLLKHVSANVFYLPD